MVFYGGSNIIVIICFVERVVMANVVKGWYKPLPAMGNGKYHYFINGVSLCNRWTTFKQDPEEFDDMFHYHSDNCKNCIKARDKKFGKAEH